MNGITELKAAAEACKDLLPLRYMHSPGGSLSIRNDHGIVFGVHQNRSFPSMMEANKAYADLVLAATHDAILALIAENEALRSKFTTVHFVCDQLPGPDDCRFIELESPQGESLGADAGKWEIRPDGLAQLVVEIAAKPGFGDAFYQVAERLGVTGARPLSPMQVFTSEVLPALDKAIKDADRYRFLRRTDSWGDIDFDDHGLWIVNSRDEVINQDGEKLDAAVDAAMSKEVSP